MQRGEMVQDHVMKLDSRRLIYPKIIFSLSIETLRRFCGYVVVKTTLKSSGKEIGFKLGQTETKSKEFGNESIMSFETIFEVPYQSGVDDLQRVVFEIFDGDNLCVSEGYLLGIVHLPLIKLCNVHHRLAILRGDVCLGHLNICNLLDVDCQEPTLGKVHSSKQPGPKTYSSVSELNSVNYFEDIVMGYFPFKVPTIQGVRTENPSKRVKVVTYTFSLLAKDLSPYSGKNGLKLMKKNDSCVFIKLCSYLKSKGSPSLAVANSADKSSGLVELWSSLEIDNKPYEITVDLIELQEEFLADVVDKATQAPRQRVLVFQVFLTNWHEHISTLPPKLICFFEILASDFTTLKGLSTFNLQRPPMDDYFEKVDDINAGKKRSSKLFQKGRSASASAELSSVDLVEAALFGKIGGVKVVDDDTAVVAGASDPSAQAKYGCLCLMNVSRHEKPVEVGPGDARYDTWVKETFKSQKRLWMKSMTDKFQQRSDEQSEHTHMTSNIMDFLMAGWTISLSAVVDMGVPCTLHLVDQIDNLKEAKNDVNFMSTVSSSSVLCILREVYNSIGVLCPNGSVRVFAGGNVCVAVDEFKFAVNKKSESTHRHWSYGMCRRIGFPLCEELLITEDNVLNPLRDNAGSERFRLLHKLGIPVDKSNTWGGAAYVKQAKYSSLNELVQGAMESGGLYHPILNKELKDTWRESKQFMHLNPGEELEQTDHRPSRKMSLLELKQRYLVANIGLHQFKVGQEFWAKVPNSLESKSKYSADVDAVKQLVGLGSIPPSSMSATNAGVVVWILGSSPSELALKKLKVFLKKYLRPEHKDKSALLIILTAECQFMFDPTENDAINCIANPFQDFWTIWDEVISNHLEVSLNSIHDANWKDNLRLVREFRTPQLCVHHSVSWAEVVASAYLAEDAEDVSVDGSRDPGPGEEDLLEPEEEVEAADAARKAFVDPGTTEFLPLMETIFKVVEENFRLSDNFRFHYHSVTTLREIVEGDSFVQGLSTAESIAFYSTRKIRLNNAGNIELKSHFDTENCRVFRSVILKFVGEYMKYLSMRLEMQSQDPRTSARVTPSGRGSERDCTACLIS